MTSTTRKKGAALENGESAPRRRNPSCGRHYNNATCAPTHARGAAAFPLIEIGGGVTDWEEETGAAAVMESRRRPRQACLLVCGLLACPFPHLEHLLDVVLVLCVYDTIHVPLEDFDQVPGEDTESTELWNRQFLLWSFG